MKESGNTTHSANLLEVLLQLEKKTMQDTKVADICKVTEVQSNNIVVSPINQQSQKCFCIKLQDLEVKSNDIVLVIFTDSDFRTNLKKIKEGYTSQDIDLSKTDLHSSNYGVIVGLIYRKEDTNATR